MIEPRPQVTTAAELQRMAWSTVQRKNLDAATGFFAARRRFMAPLDARGRPVIAGVEVVGIGLEAIRRSLRTRTCRELLSIGVDNSAAKFEASFDGDYALITTRVPVISLYDYDSTDDGGKAELSRRRGWGNSFYCSSRLQLKIYDRRCVVMEIPPVRGERTVVAVTDRAVLVEALGYFRTVQRIAIPVGQLDAVEELPEFTDRQYKIIRLLSQGYTDSQIAAAVGVSVRTVYYDMSAINRQLGVTSRFEAGARLAQLGMAVDNVGGQAGGESAVDSLRWHGPVEPDAPSPERLGAGLPQECGESALET